MRTLLTTRGEPADASIDEIRRRIRSDQAGFWLDIEEPGQEDLDLLLSDFGFHHLTVEDVRQRNQRPKLDEFHGYSFAVLFTAEARGDELAYRENHLYLSKRWLVTVRNEPSPPLEDLRKRIAETADLTRDDLGFLEYLVVSALVACLFPTLDSLDETIDALEDGVVAQATPETLARITGLKHEVTELRRIIGPQRDVFQRLLAHSLEHSRGELSLYWRDVYEDLVRQYEQVDSLRDLITGAMDVYLSTVSNRLNATMKQLTVIASVFLPLSFITGFFGMNFTYLVAKISGPGPFAAGVAFMAISLGVQLILFRRRGWI